MNLFAWDMLNTDSVYYCIFALIHFCSLLWSPTAFHLSIHTSFNPLSSASQSTHHSPFILNRYLSLFQAFLSSPACVFYYSCLEYCVEHETRWCIYQILVWLNYWYTWVISFIIISPSFFVPPFILFSLSFSIIYQSLSIELFLSVSHFSSPGSLQYNVLHLPSFPSFPHPFLSICLSESLTIYASLLNPWPPSLPTLSAGTRPVWRQIRSWTRTLVRGWVWAAVRPSPMAVTMPMWQPPNVWPNVSSTWMASGSLMWRATSAKSKLLEGYCVIMCACYVIHQ